MASDPRERAPSAAAADADPRLAALRAYAHAIEEPAPPLPAPKPARSPSSKAQAIKSLALIVATVLPVGAWSMMEDVHDIRRAHAAVMRVTTSAPARIVSYEAEQGACGRYRNAEGATLRFYENSQAVWVERTPGRWFTPALTEGAAADAFDHCAPGPQIRGRWLRSAFAGIALLFQG